MWSGGYSATHPRKDSVNADRFLHTDRALGVFDGVGGVARLGFEPSAMAEVLKTAIEQNLKSRLEVNAQRYDREVQLLLKSSVLPASAGWLRNLCAAAFYHSGSCGSSCLGVCHVTGTHVHYKIAC